MCWWQSYEHINANGKPLAKAALSAAEEGAKELYHSLLAKAEKEVEEAESPKKKHAGSLPKKS